MPPCHIVGRCSNFLLLFPKLRFEPANLEKKVGWMIYRYASPIMGHFAKLFLFLQMKYSIEGYLALLLRSWQTSLTLTKVYPLFIKRSKTKKTAQIISVVFKCFNNSLLAISIWGRGNMRGREPRLRSRSKAKEKANAVVLTFVEWKEYTGDFFRGSAAFEKCYTKEAIFLTSFYFKVPFRDSLSQ